MHRQLPSGARGLNCVSSVHLHPFFVCTSSEDSGQCAHVCTLTCAFFAENCNKHSISYVLVNTNEPARSLRLVDKKQVIVSNLGVDGF